MPLKVLVELQIHAVTCPGVFLPEKHDIYLSVCIMGQYKETECLPPIFPLLFHEKMWFEKVFESAVDPAAVTEMLESNVTTFGLIQLVSSGIGLVNILQNNSLLAVSQWVLTLSLAPPLLSSSFSTPLLGGFNYLLSSTPNSAYTLIIYQRK
nr:spermatogenesis associated 6-like protein [Chelonoidis abingdonii]